MQGVLLLWAVLFLLERLLIMPVCVMMTFILIVMQQLLKQLLFQLKQR